MTPFKKSKLKLPHPKTFIAEQMLLYKKHGITRAIAKENYNRLKSDSIWINDTYQVNIAYGDNVPNNMFGVEMIHLSIKRRDKKTVRDWRDIQQIKNELVGPDHEGFELFPAENRLVDGANQYHIFCFAEPERYLPIGWRARAVNYEPPLNSGVTQRPEGQSQEEEDAPTKEEVTIEQIMEAAKILDNADVPQKDRVVALVDPDTGEYVSSEDNPERIREIIAKFVGEKHDG